MSKEVQWHRVGPVDDLRQTKMTEFVVGERIIGLFLDNERWYAMDSVCAHQGGPLVKGFVADGCVTCPWHGWQYELDSGCNTVTKKKMLETYPVRAFEGYLEVGIPC